MSADQKQDDSQGASQDANSQEGAGGIVKGQTYKVTIHLPIDFDPNKTDARFARHGIGWILHIRYFLGLPLDPDAGRSQLEALIERVAKEAEEVVRPSELVKGLNLDDTADSKQAMEILERNQDAPEWWAAFVYLLSKEAREALEKEDVRLGMWAVWLMQAARARMIYQQSIEKLMWVGYTTAELRTVLKMWAENQGQTEEEYWQKIFSENAIILSQLFAFPVVILKGKAYLGGKGIENAGGKIVDFLVRNQLSQNTAIVEIKTPKTPLLRGTPYREGVFSASGELSGAVSQALSYKHSLGEDYLYLSKNSTEDFHAFNPQCLVIAGNYGDELKTEDQRRSFELFRATLRDVQVITYDEVFAKLKALLDLLGA